MPHTSFFDSNLFTWVILPILIFLARICDMSLDTMRIIFIGQGRKLYVFLLGFVEVSIWLLVARQVIVHLPNPLCFIAYAFGFATGNYVGMWIEERMAVGAQMIRVITPQNGNGLMRALQAAGFGVTSIAAQGSKGDVHVVYTVVKRCDVKPVIDMIRRHDPKAFYTIEDVRRVSEGVFPASRQRREERF